MILDNGICGEVELNKLTLLRPTLLLRYNHFIIDKSDYNEIKDREDTGWRKIMKNNLLFLEDIGAIRVVDYSQHLTEYPKHYIKRTGEDIVKKLSKPEKQKLLLSTWKDYIEYIEIKAFHTQGNELEYRKQCAFLSKLRRLYKSIEENNWDDDVQDYILKSCFWKTLASSNVSKKVNNSVLHLANEYSPFVDYIKPVAGNERITKIDYLVKHLYSLSLPSVKISNFSEQKAFIDLRKNKLNDYLNLCEQLEEILETFEKENASLEDVKSYLTDRWKFGYFSLNNYFGKLNNLALLPEFLIQVIVKTFQYFYPIIPEVPVPNDIIKSVTKKGMHNPLKSLSKSKEQWQVTFSSVLNETEIKRMRKHLLKEYTSNTSDDSNLSNWIENPGELPWYVNSKYD